MVMPATFNTGSLESYFHGINKIPLLTAQEEFSLAKRYREENDLEAARQLVMSHLRFVVKIVKGYSGYGLPQSDLVQEGSIGLMKAVKRFDPSIGVRLVSFAVHWIRAEIHEYILKNWKIVKIATTKAQRKLFFNLRSLKKRLSWLHKDEVDFIAKELNVKPQDVIEMEKRLSSHDISFDAPADSSSDEPSSFAPANYLADHNLGPEQEMEFIQLENLKLGALNKAMDQLDERSKNIIHKRWLSENKRTLHQLADDYQISAERIRQLEQAAFRKIAQFIQ